MKQGFWDRPVPKPPPYHAGVDKSLIMNNLDIDANVARGAAYDAAGKAKAAVGLTIAAEALWSQTHSRNL